VLVKKETMKEEKVYKCVVETLCPRCVAKCKTGENPDVIIASTEVGSKGKQTPHKASEPQNQLVSHNEPISNEKEAVANESKPTKDAAKENSMTATLRRKLSPLLGK
jgi:hypothetical protein